MVERNATALIGVYWDDRNKRWDLVGHLDHARAARKRTADSTVEIGESGLILLLEALKAEIEGWLV